MSVSTKKLAQVGMLLALSYLGSLIKIPTPVGTTAFDSAPAYFSGLLLGGMWGALVGFFGHLFTALVSGFPLSLPIHLVIAIGMGASVLLFSYLYRRSRALGIIGALLANGVLLPLALLAWPNFTLHNGYHGTILIASYFAQLTGGRRAMGSLGGASWPRIVMPISKLLTTSY